MLECLNQNKGHDRRCATLLCETKLHATFNEWVNDVSSMLHAIKYFLFHVSRSFVARSITPIHYILAKKVVYVPLLE